jgi:predicted phage tail protein
MKRNVYLQGELGNKFGKEHQIVATHLSDILKCLEVNYPDLRAYLAQSVEEGVQFSLQVTDEFLEDEDVLQPLAIGDVIIAPIPAGSKSGGAKLLTAAVIFGLLLIPGGAAAIGIGSNMLAGTSTVAGALANAGGIYAAAGLAAMSIATNLALAGISQIMAPDPSVDAEQEEGYLFSGGAPLTIEGDPVPVLYGELLIPGQPISVGLKSVSSTNSYAIYNTNEADHTNHYGENTEIE